MNIELLRRRVETLKAYAGDDEFAHSTEDLIWADVLQAIADGARNPAELAKEALKTRDIEFYRWCA